MRLSQCLDNLIENKIRPLALGRKNYLFCGNDASAYRAAIVYSLIGTCKAAGIEPREWLEDVLTKIPYYLRDDRDMTELLPRTWANLASTGNELLQLAPNSPEQETTWSYLGRVVAICNNRKRRASPVAYKETAVAIVQRLQGTELFSLLENSIEGASRKIAELLDSTLSSEAETGSSTLRKSDLGDFDIGEFV